MSNSALRCQVEEDEEGASRDLEGAANELGRRPEDKGIKKAVQQGKSGQLYQMLLIA